MLIHGIYGGVTGTNELGIYREWGSIHWKLAITSYVRAAEVNKLEMFNKGRGSYCTRRISLIDVAEPK